MKKKIYAFYIIPILLTGCGTDKIVTDIPSPNKSLHVEVRKCPERGAFLDPGEVTQVSVLEARKSEPCNSFINALVQFDSKINANDGKLELEWISDTVLRAWHPTFTADYGPNKTSVRPNAGVTIRFASKP